MNNASTAPSLSRFSVGSSLTGQPLWIAGWNSAGSNEESAVSLGIFAGPTVGLHPVQDWPNSTPMSNEGVFGMSATLMI
jgi:hypothetical protein